MSETKRVNFHMDNDLFVEVKIKMLKEGTNMTNILIGFLEAYIGTGTDTGTNSSGFRDDFTEDEYVSYMRNFYINNGLPAAEFNAEFYANAYRETHQ